LNNIIVINQIWFRNNYNTSIATTIQ